MAVQKPTTLSSRNKASVGTAIILTKILFCSAQAKFLSVQGKFHTDQTRKFVQEVTDERFCTHFRLGFIRIAAPLQHPLSSIPYTHRYRGCTANLFLKHRESQEERVVLCASKNGSENNINSGGTIDPTLLFPGKHKWLGGAMDHQGDGSIYGVPSHAHGVIRIRTNMNEKSVKESSENVITINLPRKCQNRRFKWLRGIITGGYLYGIPSWCNSGVLKVCLSSSNPDKCGLHILPLPGRRGQSQRQNRDYNVDTTRWMWHGAALNADESAIYCIPSNAERVLRIDLRTDVVTEIGPRFKGPNKWYGGIRGEDGAIYGIPYRASGVLRIDPETDSVEVIGEFGVGLYNWHGGVMTPSNGAIYAFPSHSDYVLKIDTTCDSIASDNDRLSLIDIHHGEESDASVTRYKWLGGCLGVDGCIYGMPSDAASILKIDPKMDKAFTFGGVSTEKNKWQGGVLSPLDGCVYAIPSNAKRVLRIDTNLSDGPQSSKEDESWRVSLVGELSSTKDKWQGGFLGRDGIIYGIPENEERILKVYPGCNTRICYM